jgi:hypothetical protein
VGGFTRRRHAAAAIGNGREPDRTVNHAQTPR